LTENRGNRVHCSLWGAYALKINELLATKDQNNPLVVVIQLAKLKKYFRTMGVCNAFYGTKILYDSELPEIIEYRKRYLYNASFFVIWFMYTLNLTTIFLLLRIDGVDIQVTQGISQATSSLSVPLPDDLLQTRKMTIEDLIECNEVCFDTQCLRIDFLIGNVNMMHNF